MQGQSIITDEKQRGFIAFFSTQLSAAKSIFQKLPKPARYFAFDCHAGSGFNDDVGVSGSPMLFAHAALMHDVSFVMHASEINKGRAKKLAWRLRDNASCFVVAGDNKQLIEMIPDIIRENGENPRYAIGSILLDPNNPSDMPWANLRKVSKACPRIDVAINFPGTAMKRIGEHNRNYINIEDIPGQIDKRYVLIRRPLGMWQFTLIVGRNVRFNDHKKLGLYHWDSETGRQLRTKVQLSRRDLRSTGQQWLPIAHMKNI